MYVVLSEGVVEWDGWKLIAEIAGWGCKWVDKKR
jgi:hypothetical protein